MPLIRKLFQGLIVTLKKLSEKLSPLLKRLLPSGKILLMKFLHTKRSPIVWFWMAVTYFFILILTLLLIKLGFSGKGLSEGAVEAGQSIIVHTKDATLVMPKSHAEQLKKLHGLVADELK